MNLLVVGNGFDLAHNLPTRYSDFLDFMTLYIIKNYNNWQYWGTRRWDNEPSVYEYYGYVLHEVRLKAVKNSPVNNLIEKYGEKFKSAIEENKSLERFYENSFFRYCLYVYSYKQSFDKEFNWIDIENEILKLLIELQSKKFTKDNLKSLTILIPNRDFDDKLTTREIFFPTVNKALKPKEIPPEQFRKNFFNCLFRELEDFSLLLKIYLKIVTDNFQNSPKKIFNINTSDSNAIFITNVLSFNYTDTSELYVPSVDRRYFINGNLNDDKIILGIENPFSGDDANYIQDNIHFFFKNVQRVLYDFSYDYKACFHDPERTIKGVNDPNSIKPQAHIYIIGHSLAVSDKYILNDIIKNADSVTIYYYNQKDKYDKIANLYQLLGDEFFSEHVNNPSVKPNISLINQDSLMLRSTDIND